MLSPVLGADCYRAQPEVCQWNLAQLANALLAAGLVEKEAAEEALEAYTDVSGNYRCLFSSFDQTNGNARYHYCVAAPSVSRDLARIDSIELFCL